MKEFFQNEEIMNDKEFLEILINLRNILNTPYISINEDLNFFVFNAKEAFEEITSEETFLKPKDFTRIIVGETSYYIARV